MRETQVSFYSEGEPIAGLLRLPDNGEGPFRGIVQGPGWMGLKDAKLYLPYHEALTAAGFAVLIFDYRGFGDSGGRTDLLIPAMQLEDLINAVTYLGSRDDIDADNIGTFGSGGTGGGNAIVLAAADPRIGCAVSQVPVPQSFDRKTLGRLFRPIEMDRIGATIPSSRSRRESSSVRPARRSSIVR